MDIYSWRRANIPAFNNAYCPKTRLLSHGSACSVYHTITVLRLSLIQHATAVGRGEEEGNSGIKAGARTGEAWLCFQLFSLWQCYLCPYHRRRDIPCALALRRVFKMEEKLRFTFGAARPLRAFCRAATPRAWRVSVRRTGARLLASMAWRERFSSSFALQRVAASAARRRTLVFTSSTVSLRAAHMA